MQTDVPEVPKEAAIQTDVLEVPKPPPPIPKIIVKTIRDTAEFYPNEDGGPKTH